MRLLIVIAAISGPPMAQAQTAVEQPSRCIVELKSDDGGKIILSNHADFENTSNITWLLPQSDPLSLSVLYEAGPSVTAGTVLGGMVDLKLVDRPTIPLTAVFRRGQKSWRIGMQAYDYARSGPPDPRVRAFLDPKTSEGRQIASSIGSGEPLTVSVEYPGGVVFREVMPPGRLRARNRLIDDARARAAKGDRGDCWHGPPMGHIAP